MARADGLVVLARVLSLGFLSVTASAEPTTGTPPRMCRDSVYALALRPWDPPAAPRQEFPAEREDLAAAMRLNELAERSLEARAYARAEPLLRRALAIADDVLAPADPQILPILRNLADLYVVENELCRAEALYRRSLAILEREVGPDSLGVSAALDDLAAVYMATRRFELAEPLYRRALAIFEAAFGVDNLHVTIGLNDLADLYVAEERYLEAEPLYRRSLAILERTFGPTDVRVAALCEKRARLLLKLHIPASTVPPKAGRM